MASERKDLRRIMGLGLLLWLRCFLAFGQREADNWFFGHKALLEFPNGSRPVSFQNSAMNALEGSASISDKNGQLLFYTNGITVWNRFHQVMKNGNNLFSDGTVTQSSLIVPKPGSNSLYYVFTNAADFAPDPGLFYSVVDISKDSVIAKTKNTKLLGFGLDKLSEKLTAVHHFNNRDVWVIANSYTSDSSPVQQINAFKITAAGIISPPVISNIQVDTTFAFPPGHLKASPDGKYLAGAFNQQVCLFNFNNKSGVVSHRQVLAVIPNTSQAIYGVEFSPDSKKLYYSNIISIKQFDLLAGNTTAIVASEVSLSLPKTKTKDFYALQLAPDKKIYGVYTFTDSMFVINNPNLKGNACNLTLTKLLAPNTLNRTGLPNFIQSYFAAPRFTFTGSCADSPVQFNIPNQTNITGVSWNFGDPSSGSGNNSQSLQPAHTFAYSGSFDVTLSIYSEGDTIVITRPVRIVTPPPIDLGADRKLCAGTSTTLRNPWPIGFYNETYKWSTGSTNGTIQVNSPGIYWLDLTVGTCVVRDSVIVTYKPTPKVTLKDQTVCGKTPVILDATYTENPGAKYLWTPGDDTTATLQVTKNGLYTVTINLNGCFATDSARVTFIPDLDFSLGEDIEVCEGKDVYLRAPLPNPPATYLWSDGSTNRYIIKATKSGKYWVRLTRGQCVSTDTINVKFKPCPPPPVPYIPNIITPGNDGQNDRFKITGIPEGAWNVQIYNRWGQLLLQQKGYRNDWPQKVIADGTYFYHLEDPDTGRTWKGWFQVVR